MGWHHLEKMGLYLPPSFESQQIQNLAKCPSLGQNGSTWSVNQNVLVCTKQRLNMSWFCKFMVKNEPTLTQSLQDPFFFWYFQLFLLFFTSYAKNPTSGHKRKLSGSKSWLCKCTVKNEPTLTQSLQDPFFWYFQLFLLFFTSYAKNPTSGHKRKLSGSKSWLCKCTVKNEPTLTQSLQDPFFWYFQQFLLFFTI